MTARRVAQACALFRRNPRSDELLNVFSLLVEHAQRAVARVDQTATQVHHFLQDRAEVKFGRQRQRRLAQSRQLLRLKANLRLALFHDAEYQRGEYQRAHAQRDQLKDVAFRSSTLRKERGANGQDDDQKENG